MISFAPCANLAVYPGSTALGYDGYTIEQHTPGPEHFTFRKNLFELGLFLTKDQQRGCRTSGHKIRRAFTDKPTANICLLHHLQRRDIGHLIPENWKKRLLFGWGTLYRSCHSSRLFVPYLFWSRRNGWQVDMECLDVEFLPDDMALLFRI